jgi:hypothetical protein
MHAINGSRTKVLDGWWIYKPWRKGAEDLWLAD